MHGRQAMLAVVGFIAPALFGKLPVAWTADVSLNPLEAQTQLPPEVLYQVVISIFIAEGLRAQIIYGPDHVPGEHGFDPILHADRVEYSWDTEFSPVRARLSRSIDLRCRVTLCRLPSPR